MESIEKVLETYPIFEGAQPSENEKVAECGKETTVKAGAWICRVGEEAKNFFMIVEGKAAVEITAPGKGDLVIQTMGPGDLIGWSWVFDPARWRFDIRALTDMTLIEFNGAAVRELCEEDLRFGYYLLKHFCRVMTTRLEAARIQLLDLYGSKKAGI